MTSQKSSISTFSFTFWSAIKGNFVLPLINMVAVTLAVPVSCFIAIKNFSNNNYDYQTGLKLDEVKKVTDYYKYLIFSDFGEVTANVLLHLSVIVFSILLGVMLFRFIANKKTVNVFYSLGITRKNLFVSKYIAGLIMLAISIIIPFVVCLLINISKFGSSTELWSAIIYHILGYCALSFTAFSLTAAVFSGVGTIIEGITFSGALMLGPTVAIYGLQFLMSKLVLGSPYGHFYDASYQVTNALATKLSGFNPILFLFKNVSAIGALARDNPTDKFIWTAPVYTDVILWFAIAAGLFLLGITVFQKRKAEICGFLGVNKWLNFIITFLIGFFPLCIAISSPLPVVAAVLIGLAIFTVLYCIIDFALIRNIKEWAKGLYKLPIHLGISLLIVVIFATGLFGFSARIPKIDDVKSVEIAPVTYSGAINPYSYYGYGEESFLYSIGESKLIEGFQTADDLKTIAGLHKLLIDAGKLTILQGDTALPPQQQVVGSDIKISYHLKNGKTVDRYYSAANVATLTAFLALDKTDRYNELITQNLTQPITDKDSDEIVANKTVFQAETSMIEIVPNTLNLASPIELSPENRALLLTAIATDLKAQTIEDQFFPKTPSMGVIRFSVNQYEDKSEFVPIQGNPAGSEMFSLVNNACASFVITGDMKNTLAFLKDNDLINLFDKPLGSDFVSALVLPAVFSNNSPYSYSGNTISLHFMGGWSKIAYDYGSFGGTYQVTDKALVDEIAANAYITYYNNVPGYYVRLEMENKGGYTTMYVPADKMPQSVVDAVARHVIVPPEYPSDKYY